MDDLEALRNAPYESELRIMAAVCQIMAARGWRPEYAGDTGQDDLPPDTILSWRKIVARGVRVQMYRRHFDETKKDFPTLRPLPPYWQPMWTLVAEHYRSLKPPGHKDWFAVEGLEDLRNVGLLEAMEQADAYACEALAKVAGFSRWKQAGAMGWSKTMGDITAVVFYGYESFANQGKPYGDPLHAFWNLTFVSKDGKVPDFPWFSDDWVADPHEGELLLGDAFKSAEEFAVRLAAAKGSA